MSAWILIAYLTAAGTKQAGGPLAVPFASKEQCEIVAVRLKTYKQYRWHICVPTE